MQIRHILREKGADIISISSEATLSEASCLLARKRIGALIVRDGRGEFAGIISERDVVRAVADESVGALARPVHAYMTRAVTTCTQDDSVDELMEVMTRGRFRHVPVVDERDRLIGIVSIGDVVKSRIEETVREAAALREYISAAG